MAILIRPVREADAEGILELLNPIIEAGTFTIMDRPFSAAEQAAFIRSLPERALYLAAVDDQSGRILGIQDVMPHSAGTEAYRHVGEISTFVALDAQRRGVGALLCQSTFQQARAIGFRKLSAVIRADNPKALAFYQSQGFRVIGTAERHALVRGRLVDQVLTERWLD